MRVLALGIALSAVSAVAVAAAAADDPLVELERRAKNYVSMRNKAAREVGKPGAKSSPEEIARYKQQLGEAVRASRADAQPGEVLSAGVFELVSAVRSETGGRQGEQARAAVLEEDNPVAEGKAFTPRVNAPYPEDAPRSTVTPDLLTKLPKLPDGLEFRFVGPTLILYDAEADLIVDYVVGVVKGEAKP